LIEIIKYGYISDIITSLRGQVSKKEYDLIKKDKIPCVTLSGTFIHRDSKSLVKHSGLMQIDIDNVEYYEATFSKLCSDDYIFVCFRSPGGKGIKAIIKINPSQETHKSQFQALELYFKNHYGITIDSLCKDLARAMLLSYDPDIYCNPFSNVFEETYFEKPYQRKTEQGSESVQEAKSRFADESKDVVERLIASLEERHIDITSSYKDWVKIGFALCTTFGEPGRGYFHRIGRMYPRYTQAETDDVYSNLLAKNNGKTKLGSIIFLAKEAGVMIKN
jgi:hypothetical protein